jgi:hypothetical protein
VLNIAVYPKNTLVHKIFTFWIATNLTKTFSKVAICAIMSIAIGKKVRNGLFLACFHVRRQWYYYRFQLNFLYGGILNGKKVLLSLLRG